jgi:hypothetical protein
MIEYRFRVPSATVFTLYSYSKILEHRLEYATAGSLIVSHSRTFVDSRSRETWSYGYRLAGGKHEVTKENRGRGYTPMACSFRWFIMLKALFAGMLWEKNTVGWLLILLISPNEQGAAEQKKATY